MKRESSRSRSEGDRPLLPPTHARRRRHPLLSALMPNCELRRIPWAALCVLGVCAGCQVNPVSQAAAETAIRDVVNATMDAVVEGDMPKYLRFFDPNSAHVLPNRPIDYGQAQRRGGFPPGYAVTMRIEKIGVAKSGDLGYAFGDYTQTKQDAKTGELKHFTGKWMDVFRREADGSWGAVADTYNVDTP